ncbi:Uncharacterised protein [Streptococcus pyogenes]|nr:Uncharacterised protein [Streptococcus pyogenes]VGV82636.1 Uncharacterised protein [Streptococcus pyogenes]VGV86813.1 Uncharacterised protein [Streptococcus pyogenes]VGW24983.1 Uncharacterised protein [Streptococcus pyogenes]VHA70753.1 Uncharacterised protein [Streptococcus pyogenes]
MRFFHVKREISATVPAKYLETKTESEISNALEDHSKSIDVSVHLERDITNEFIAKGNCKIFYVLSMEKIWKN